MPVYPKKNGSGLYNARYGTVFPNADAPSRVEKAAKVYAPIRVLPYRKVHRYSLARSTNVRRLQMVPAEADS
ncbi:hypothetical protein D3C73_1351890 [compost metagenome]